MIEISEIIIWKEKSNREIFCADLAIFSEFAYSKAVNLYIAAAIILTNPSNVIFRQ